MGQVSLSLHRWSRTAHGLAHAIAPTIAVAVDESFLYP
jgi:hypothetical protein